MKNSDKYKKFKNNTAAARQLINENFLEEAATLLWQSIRELIFEYLFQKRIGYNSTREALKKFLIDNQYDMQLLSDVLTLERVATLSEWDETFNLNHNEIAVLEKIHAEISKKILQNGSN